MTTVTVSLDAMGGDHGCSVVVPAALLALEKHKNLCVVLVGQEELIHAQLAEHGAKPSDSLIVHHASEVVGMDESPSHALRNKKDSSMRVALNLLKQAQADACVSAGNTGALMATARFVLRMLPGVDRPAIISELPAIGKTVRVLDLGANVDSSAEHLFQFAALGSMLITAVDGIERPTIGLLNVGEEQIKGNEQVKKTAQLLSENQSLNYQGYIEGDAIYQGVVDLVVCDGFVGNVTLKVTEGAAKLIGHFMKEAFHETWASKLAGFIAKPVLKRFYERINPARYNGASFLGLKGIVVKSHGRASVLAFAHAIDEAILEVEKNVLAKISDQIPELLQGSPS